MWFTWSALPTLEMVAPQAVILLRAFACNVNDFIHLLPSLLLLPYTDKHWCVHIWYWANSFRSFNIFIFLHVSYRRKQRQRLEDRHVRALSSAAWYELVPVGTAAAAGTRCHAPVCELYCDTLCNRQHKSKHGVWFIIMQFYLYMSRKIEHDREESKASARFELFPVGAAAGARAMHLCLFAHTKKWFQFFCVAR